MPERPPDPFRPAEVPRGRPFGALGRPTVAVGVVLAIVGAAIVLMLIVWLA